MMNGSRRQRLVIMRGSSQYVSPDHYNVQEIGLGKALTEMGWEVTILSSGPDEKEVRVNDHLTWKELKRVGGRMGWPDKAVGALLQSNCDIMQCQDISNIGIHLSYTAAKKSKTPFVLSLGEYQSDHVLKNLYARLTASRISGYLSGVLCKTNAAVNYAQELHLNPAIYAPVGIDPTAYSSEVQESSRGWIAAINDYRKQGFKILCHMGRLDKEDNLLFLQSVLGKLKGKYLLVAAGEPRTFVEGMGIYSTVKDRVMLLGKVPNNQIGHLLGLSDLYLACSSYEIFGMSAAESIFHHCPVMGYSTGGIAEIVQDQVNGCLMENRNPEQWALEIESSFSSGAAARWREGCLETRDALTWSNRAKAYHHTYLNILRGEDKQHAG